MGAYPSMAEGNAIANVFGEHAYKVRVTFGAAGATSFRSMHATFTKVSATQWKLTLPMVYHEVTDFSFGWVRADGQNVLIPQIVANNVTVDGTLTIECLTSAGVASTPGNGDVLFLTVYASQDVQNDKYVGTG